MKPVLRKCAAQTGARSSPTRPPAAPSDNNLWPAPVSPPPTGVVRAERPATPPAARYLLLTGDCVRYAVSVRAAPVMAAVFKFAGVTLPEAVTCAALDTAPPITAAASPFIHNAKLFMRPSCRNTRCIAAPA